MICECSHVGRDSSSLPGFYSNTPGGKGNSLTLPLLATKKVVSHGDGEFCTNKFYYCFIS